MGIFIAEFRRFAGVICTEGTRFLTRIVSRIRGNPKAFAVSFASLACVFAALNVGKYDPSLISGALMGAGVSIAVASVVEFFQAPDARRIPYQFIEGAKREVHLIGYYRDQQEVHIDFTEVTGKPDRIKLSFDSRVIPIRDQDLTLYYPKIEAPDGLVKSEVTYKIDGETVPPGGQKILTRSATESLVVEYEVDKNIKQYSDAHVWLSPVLDYEVFFKLPANFICDVQERIGDITPSLNRSGRQVAGEVHYSQSHSAFSRQGFRWTLLRPAA